MLKVLQPPGWSTPKGYSNGVLTQNKGLIFIAGQIGWNAREEFESDKLVAQSRQALHNVLLVLNEAGANAEHIVRMTWFITDKQAYLDNTKELGKAYREVIGDFYPPMSMVQVVALMEDEAKVEIEVTAAI
jgi:enamine deaminase RidA (YjgF/YER057c/UK114 family)